MVVRYIFRKRNDDTFSIERVFQSIIDQLAGQIEISTFNVPLRSAGIFSILKNLYSLLVLRFSDSNSTVYHVTGDIHYAVFALPRSRTILTIHDSVFMKNNGGFKRWIFKKIWLDWPLSFCRYVTTISEKSKEEILRHTNCNPSTIIVINNPVSNTIFFREKIFNNKTPSILFLGTKANKNLSRSIQALSGFKCILHIVGVLNDSQKSELKSCNVSYVSYSSLTDSEIAHLYSDCDLVLFPSTYEGFGMPIIESQKAGRPIITSDIQPLNVLSGDGACLVVPESVESIRNGVEKVVTDDDYRNLIVENGFNNVIKFYPSAIAGLYLSLYKKVFQ